MPVARTVNRAFFKVWSPEMAYVLGFFAADGYITVSKRGAHFWCAQINDRDLLEEIRNVIGSNHAISIRERPGNANNAYRLQVGSREMCDDLRALGMRERKTRVMQLPSIPDNYLADFVRGYFDGDGNVWVGYMHKGRGVSNFAIQSAFTSCSVKFLEQLQTRLLAIGLKGGSIYRTRKGYARLQFSIRDSLKLADFMYNLPTGPKNSLSLNGR